MKDNCCRERCYIRNAILNKTASTDQNIDEAGNSFCLSVKSMMEGLSFTDFKATRKHNGHPALTTHKDTVKNLDG